MKRVRVKVLYRKNLNMSPGKLAAQTAHAVLGLAHLTWVGPQASIVVLGVSDKKFDEAKAECVDKHIPHPEAAYCVVRDLGYTELAPGTETCVAFLEEDPRETESTQT